MNPVSCMSVIEMFNSLDQGGKIMAEYVWIGGDLLDIRSKTRTLDFIPKNACELPEWNFDGSSTGQAPTDNSEVILKPCALFRDPFRRGSNLLVLCDTYRPDGTPTATNKRNAALKIFQESKGCRPWYGLEQEYTLFYKDYSRPLGWPQSGFPGPQGPYYCSVGADRAYGRIVSDAHYKACLYSGVNISGTNAEVMPGQWEYQVGPCEGIEAGDHFTISRYLLHRVCETFDVVASLDPKPVAGDWNGAGCHINFSTEEMRNDGGIKGIHDAIDRLKKRHVDHIKVYGNGNERRLTGAHETSSLSDFTYGVGSRGASIRIPTAVDAEGKGYLEDRRPASNIDGYEATSIICETVCL
eukprot:gb/GECH01012318.1/.p1 GENE.gb/GECH01012318.1/~~gb/GECH01012318.1/.p1  ORF type:complete len:355 (+),score=82.26 gb/GECH01012318.1/:1-1065(+)